MSNPYAMGYLIIKCVSPLGAATPHANRHAGLPEGHIIPDDTVINSKVAMYQSVTHTSHRSPFQVTVFLLEVI